MAVVDRLSLPPSSTEVVANLTRKVECIVRVPPRPFVFSRLNELSDFCRRTTPFRVRLRFNMGDSPNKPTFHQQKSALVSMQIDGHDVTPETIVLPKDRYLLYPVREDKPKRVTIVVKDLLTQREETLHADLGVSP